MTVSFAETPLHLDSMKSHVDLDNSYLFWEDIFALFDDFDVLLKMFIVSVIKSTSSDDNVFCTHFLARHGMSAVSDNKHAILSDTRHHSAQQ